eukprot:scaffold910_cov396-Prasinococcus_capsulatus_cf.AAC.9
MAAAVAAPVAARAARCLAPTPPGRDCTDMGGRQCKTWLRAWCSCINGTLSSSCPLVGGPPKPCQEDYSSRGQDGPEERWIRHLQGLRTCRGKQNAGVVPAGALFEVSSKAPQSASVVRMANKSARRGAMASTRRPLPFASISMSVADRNERGRGKQGAESVQMAVDSNSATVPFATKLHNPVLLFHQSTIPKGAFLFLAGGIAGAISKTITAPLDRVKLLMQTQKVAQVCWAHSTVDMHRVRNSSAVWMRGRLQGSVVSATKGGFLGGLVDIARKEGVTAYWKGNIPQLIRILPYRCVDSCSCSVQAGVVC